MAFGKKKDEGEAPAAQAPDAPDDGVEVSEALFAEEAPEAAGSTDENPPAAAPAAADPLGGDLLNMFQTTQIEEDDLTVLLELAGDVEIDDLLEDLQTIATAMGCKVELVEEYAAA